MNETGNPLDSYVTELLEAKQIPDTMENHAKLVTEVSDYIDNSLLEALPEDALDKLTDLAESDSMPDTIVEDLLVETGNNPEMIMKDALVKFKTAYQERSL